jgi:N-acetylmuramoyl-L-alanine amidase
MTFHSHNRPKPPYLLVLFTVLFFLFSGIAQVGILRAGQQEDAGPHAEKYNRAKDYYYLLLRDENVQADRANWMNGVSAFRRIYLDNPKGELAPNCLFMMAKMYYRMYMRFHKQTDLDESIAYYTDVYSLFPGNTLADDALFWSGEIYLKDKKNPRQAAKLYAKQLQLYPDGDKYGQAASRLQEIKGEHAIELPRKYAVSREKKKLMQVLPVQYWSSDDYTRIVIRSSGPVTYKSTLTDRREGKPRTLMIDFAQSSIEARYTTPVPIEEGLLRRIRSRQLDATTVRVALDIASISTYKIFSLNDPFRVIVDVHGQQGILTASKPLPRVGEEKVASRPRSPGRIEPANRKKASEKLQVELPHERGEPFIVLEDSRKRKPGTEHARERSSEYQGLTLAQQLGLRVRRIVLDPGHGGKDPGAIANGLREKDITLKVARMTAAILQEKYDYEVIMTRDRDTSLPLEERTAIANTSKADLFVSIHVNAHPSASVRGIETFYLNLATNTEAMRVAARENATTTHQISDLQDILSELMQNSRIEESSVLADYVQNSLVSGLRKNRYDTENLGVKQAPFYVLLGAEMPAVLAEISFLSNKSDASRLRDEKYLAEIAAQIAAGVAGYVEHQARAALQF